MLSNGLSNVFFKADAYFPRSSSSRELGILQFVEIEGIGAWGEIRCAALRRTIIEGK